ncbi:MAG: glycosyltransferase, partial [Chloroflexota bacterium]|nr:glycosyltransferase [Chloroflexota bacterium]
MSRILFLTPQLPHPPHQGAAIRNLNLVKLASQRHQVAICSFVRDPRENAAIPVLKQWACDVRTVGAPRRSLAERALWTAFSAQPDMGRRLKSAAFARLIEDADVVQAEGIEMAQYLASTAAGRVLDCHNAEWLLQRRTCLVDLRERKLLGAAYSALQWLKLRRYERIACQRADAVAAVSDEDRQALLALDPLLRVTVIPNG